MRSSGSLAVPSRATRGAAAACRPPGFRGAALLALLVLAAPAPAARPAVRIVDAGAALSAGQSVVVAWEGLPPDVDEVELLLSVDGGRRFPLRLTGSLDADEGSLTWVVPALSVASARVRLRFGRAGCDEEESDPSAPFEILAPPSSPSARFERREGEWWVVDASGPVPSGLRSAEDARPLDGDDAPAALAEDDGHVEGPPGPLGEPGASPARLASLPGRARPAFPRGPEAPKRE
ncbi:MAG: hypothetical protein U0529_06895 [Thermoanaerobaculia bacterium]